jgi:hypothetical protein
MVASGMDSRMRQLDSAKGVSLGWMSPVRSND